MRFIITAQAGTDETKARKEPAFDEALFIAYMRFNEEMHRAGILVASEGLNPAAPGARVAVSQGKRHVVDGPFAESKELVGGFYIIDVKSLDEAISWALRAPSGFGSDDVLEVRQLTGAGDLPPELLKIIASVAPTWSASAWQSRT
jgi:hypothetical protein